MTLVDFTVTQKGLEEQLLGRVIGKEQKALEEQLSEVLEEVNSNTKVPKILVEDSEYPDQLRAIPPRGNNLTSWKPRGLWQAYKHS